MGTYRRQLDKEIIPLLFAPVLFRQMRPESDVSLKVTANPEVPTVNQPVRFDYYVMSDGDTHLFSITYAPFFLFLKETADFQYANEIEVSGDDISDRVLDRAIAKYKEVYQTPMDDSKAN